MKTLKKFFLLRHFLPLLILGALSLSSLGVNIYLNTKSRTLVYEKVFERLQSVADSLIFNLATMRDDFFSEDTQKNLQRILEKVLAQRQFVAAYFVGVEDKILVDGGHFLAGEKVPRELSQYVNASLQNLKDKDGVITYDEKPSAIFVRPLEGGTYDSVRRSSVIGTLVVVYDLTSENEVLDNQFRVAVFLSVLATLLASFLVYAVVSWRVVKPIRSIQNTVQQVGSLNFTDPAKVYFNDELGSVAVAINRMLEQLNRTSVSKTYVDRILASMADLVVVTDLKGNVKTMNRVAHTHFGMNEGLNEEKISQFFTPDSNFETFFSKLINSKTSISDYEANLITFTKGMLPVSVSGSVIINDVGHSEGILLNVRDISERKEIERNLEHANIASMSSSKMASLGEMAGGIAHEINNPLAVISILSAQLKELVTETSPDFNLISEMATNIDSTVLRIAKIVKSLRSFSRDASQDPFVTSDLKKILDETLVFCAERYKQHGIELEVKDVPANLKIHCRPTEITQVILNLLNNAYDAVSELKQKWVRLEVSERDELLEISITDSGNGIPPEVAQKLFQPFFTTKPIGKGTGLGLGISKRIIENHRGILIVDHEAPNTRFVIKLYKAQNLESLRKVA